MHRNTVLGSFTKQGKLATLALFLCFLVAIPILAIFFSFQQFNNSNWSHLIDTVLLEYITNSLLLMLGVGFGTGLIGSTLAWINVKFDYPGRSIMQWAVLLPLAMPAYIIAYAYTGMLDFAGPVQTALRETFTWRAGDYWFPEVRSLSSAAVLMSLVLYPYVYLLARSAFKNQSPALEEVSQLAGKSALQHVLSVTLPLARPAILLGCILAMMEALADFGTVEYFGVPTLTTGIFRTWFGMGDVTTASQLSALLCTFVFVLLYLEFNSRQTSQAYQTKHLATNHRRPITGIKGVGVLLICALPVLLGFLVPFLQLFQWSLTYTDHASFDEFFELASNSFTLAIIGALVIVLFALLVSYAKRRKPYFTIVNASRFVSLGYAMPGTVIAVGILAPVGWLDTQINALTMWWNGSIVGLVFSGTLFTLIFAYTVRFASIALQHADTGLQRISKSIDEVSASMNRSAFFTFRKVHLPLIKTSLLSAFLLVFVDILKELPATLVLRPFNFNTLAVKTFELASDERLIAAALPAITIVTVGIVPVILLTKTLEKTH